MSQSGGPPQPPGYPPPPPGYPPPPQGGQPQQGGPQQGYPKQGAPQGYPPPPPGYPQQQQGYPPPPPGYPQQQQGYPPPPPGYPQQQQGYPQQGYPQQGVGPAGGVVCYKCGSPHWQRVTKTWWGGWLGPAMFSHARCQCGATFSSKTGKSNDTAIAIYFVVTLCIVGAIFAAITAK